MEGVGLRRHGEAPPGLLGQADTVLAERIGTDWVAYFTQIKRLEWQRFRDADDPDAFQRREYFSRF